MDPGEPLGGSDCEAILGGAVAQPFNAWSSLAFCLAGLWILVRAARAEPGRRGELAVFGLAVFSNGVGSFSLHGPQPGWGRWAHDLAIVAALWFVAVHGSGLVAGLSRRARLGVYAAGLVVAGAAMAISADADRPLFAVAGAGAVAAELLAVRAGLRPRPLPGTDLRSVAWLGAAGALAVGGIAFFLGRTGSLLCDPDAVFQFHGLWHSLQAVAMVAYAYAALELWSPPAERAVAIEENDEGVSSA